MSFRVGEKVVCIDAREGEVYQRGVRLVMKGQYVITGVTNETPAPAVQIDGLGISGARMAIGNDWLRASRFRPQVSGADDIALFKSLLAPEGVFQDALLRMDLP